MKILNFGSLNVDLCYQVERFAVPGETVSSRSFERRAGGKGLNQSLALARAGAPVAHAGCVGQDGLFLRDLLAAEGVDCAGVRVCDRPTGHAVIQIDSEGRNGILLHAGANHAITAAHRRAVLSAYGRGDWLLLQNEINDVKDLMEQAAAQGMTVAFNPSPFDGVDRLPVSMVHWWIMNEYEAAQLAGTGPEQAPSALLARFPHARFVITLGARGAVYLHGDERLFTPALPVKAVDTTGAGDTFTGYFLAAILKNEPVGRAMEQAAAAAAVSVTRPGAADSVPTRRQVDEFLRQQEV